MARTERERERDYNNRKRDVDYDIDQGILTEGEDQFSKPPHLGSFL